MRRRYPGLESRQRPASRAHRHLCALFAVAVTSVLVLASGRAHAQVGLGQPGGLPQPPLGAPGQPPGTGQTMPQTHAASGAESPAKLPTQEPMLPEDPNKIPKKVKKLIGSDADEEYEQGREPETEHTFYGVYYGEQSGEYRFQTTLPLPFWLERTQGTDRASLYGLMYYNRRSEDIDADVLFPLFWKTRYDDKHTTIVGPVLHSESSKGHDNWVAPLFFEGSNTDGGGYFHIPPLLTFTDYNANSGFAMVGPLFCDWAGGPNCDVRTADDIDLGLAPLYFYGRDDRSEYEVIPPLLHYYEYTEKGDHSLSVWGPFWSERSRDGGVFDILPIYWRNWGANEDHITVFPLFHYGYEGAASRLITPLFVTAEDDEGADTFVTWLYAQHRGRTELDMITPLFWQYRDPDIELTRTLLFPLFYHNTSPRSDDLVLFPFGGRFHRHHISDTIWITPLFRHTTDLTGWETDILPLFYMGRDNRSTHLVLAPVLWDFASPKSRGTVVFPLYWRFSTQESVSQLVLNTYYRESIARGGGLDWEVHFFPLFSYGESPDGHWWNILYGLAGYTREGTMAKMRISYIPIKLSE